MEEAKGAITINDVAEAVGLNDPHQTNAAAIRNVLGRGSLATIQKHLGTLRDDYRAANDVPADLATAPAAPADAVAALWQTAYAVAAAKVAVRMEILAQERDAAVLSASTAHNDIAALTDAVDAAEAAQIAALADLDHEKQLAAAAIDAMRESHDAVDTDYAEDAARASAEAAAAALEREHMAHDLALAKRDIEIVRGEHQRTIDNLNAQVAELKSLLTQLRQN